METLEGSDMEVGRNGLIDRMIAHGVRAGALRAGARRYPEAAKGLSRAADFHSAKVGLFADEILAEAVGAAPLRD